MSMPTSGTRSANSPASVSAGCHSRWSLLLPATLNSLSSAPCPPSAASLSAACFFPSNTLSPRTWTPQKPALSSSCPSAPTSWANFWIGNKLYFWSCRLRLLLGVCLRATAMEEATRQPLPRHTPGPCCHLQQGQRSQAIHLAPHSRHQGPGDEEETLMSHHGPVMCPPPPSPNTRMWEGQSPGSGLPPALARSAQGTPYPSYPGRGCWAPSSRRWEKSWAPAKILLGLSPCPMPPALPSSLSFRFSDGGCQEGRLWML